MKVKAAVVLVLLFVVSTAQAQTWTAREIKFPRGKSTVVLKGNLTSKGKGRHVLYTVTVRENQKLHIVITSPKGNARFYPPLEEDPEGVATPFTEWEGTVPNNEFTSAFQTEGFLSGSIMIATVGGPAAYTLKVTLK